jgi:hypothetical protein
MIVMLIVASETGSGGSVVKINEEDIKHFDDIRLIVLGAALGASLAKFELDPADPAAPFFGIIFIMAVILAAFGANMLSTAKTPKGWFLRSLYPIIFAAIIPFLGALSDADGNDITTGFIGIDRKGMFLIQVTIGAWVLTSMLIGGVRKRHHLPPYDAQSTRITAEGDGT